MLEDSLLESRGASKGRMSATLISSAGIHLAIVMVLVLIPLLQINAIPALDMWRPLPVPALKSEVISLVRAENRVQPRIEIDPTVVIAPQLIPREIAYVVEPPSVPIVVSSNPNGTTEFGSILRDLANRQSESAIPTPPPPPAQPAAAATEESKPVRIGGNLQQANLIRQVRPVYSPIAIQVRAQGVVVLEAVINKEGTIDSLRVVSGPPLLVQSAIDAVKQWMYRPTLLNGLPVEVITTITVSFSLN